MPNKIATPQQIAGLHNIINIQFCSDCKNLHYQLSNGERLSSIVNPDSALPESTDFEELFSLPVLSGFYQCPECAKTYLVLEFLGDNYPVDIKATLPYGILEGAMDICPQCKDNQPKTI